MAEDIVVRYRAEVDEALKKIQVFADANTDVEKSTTKAGKSIDKTTKSVDHLGKETQATSKQIKDSTKSVDDFAKKGEGAFNGLAKSAKSFALGAGAALAAAFSVDAIIQFGKASITAFLDAEKNAERLKFAITSIGGESEAAFDRLIKQSSELQKITVFDDDSIQQAQAALSAFGLTANEIERTIPLLADFATVTGKDIVAAAQELGTGLEGAGREFKKYGIEVSATASRQTNLNNILQGFGKFAGSAEAATQTLSGQLEQLNNEAADLQEEIGSRLAPAFVSLKVGVFDLIKTLIDLPSTASRAIQGLFGALSGGNSFVEIQKNSYEEYEDAIRKTLLATQDLKALEEATNKARVDQTKNVAQQQATIDRLLQRAEDIRSQSNGNLREAESLEKAVGVIRDTNLQNEINKLLLIDKVEAERRAELLKASTEAKKFTDERIAGSDKEVKLLTTLTAQYKDLQAVFNLTDEQKALFTLALKTGDVEEFRQAVAQLGAENPVEIPVTLVLPDDRKDFDIAEPIEQQTERIKISFSEILAETSSLVGQISGIFNNLTNQRLEEIDRVKDAEFEALDAQLQANQDALNRRQISEQDFENNRNKLLQQRQAAEASAARKERELKRKQAQLNKAASIAQATINIAEAVTKALTAGPVVGQVLAALTAALGAVELGIIASTPIPYAKGTKKAKKGLARVGEQGEEIMYVPGGTKVLPNKQTNRYAEVLDAMFDNRFDQLYIKRKEIAPQLIRQKQIREVNTQKSFAENIAQSAMVNPATGLTYFDMRQALGKGTSINGISPEAADAIGKAFARHIQSNPFRQ